MTKKLFHSDPYKTSCQAVVQSIDNNTVVLNQTVFFAFSGGQESDTGTIDDIDVIRATDTSTKNSAGNIMYELKEQPTFSVGDTVSIEIHSSRRNSIMRLHTAVHLVYYAVIKHLGDLRVVGSHISEDKGRIDFETDTNLNEIRDGIQKQVEKQIAQEHPITIDSDPNDSHIRIWKCNGYSMPCAGTHVQNTKDIGNVTIKRKNIGSGKERFEITIDSATE